MKRLLAISALLFLSMLVFSQDFDFKIDPIENETSRPNTYDNQHGNYAGIKMKIDIFEPQIEGSLSADIYAFVIDTGIDFDHPYLRDHILKKYAKSFVPGEEVNDMNSHGTHVAGCAFAYATKIRLGTGQILSKNKKVHIIPIKALSNAGNGNYIWVRKAVNYARTIANILPADAKKMIIMSLGGGSGNSVLESAIKAAREDNIFVFIAAGNTGGTPVQFPGRAKGADAIGSVGSTIKRSYFSSYGKEIMFVAPGENILAPIPGGQIGNKSGTSMSTPTLAGAVAVYWSMHPTATANQVEQAFAANSTDILPDGRDQLTGFGMPTFGMWIFEDTSKYPDKPVGWLQDGTNPELTREKRTVSFIFNDVPLLWKTLSDNELSTMYYDVIVEFETKLYDVDAYKAMDEIIQWYSTHSAVVLKTEHGFIDATYWGGGFFLELIGNRNYDLAFTVKEVTGINNEGYITTIQGRKFHKKSIFGGSLKRLRAGSAYAFEIK